MNTSNELTALQNFEKNLNKKFNLNIKVKLWFEQDKRKKTKFILVIDNHNHTCISPILNYDKMNHFMLGISRAKEYKF